MAFQIVRDTLLWLSKSNFSITGCSQSRLGGNVSTSCTPQLQIGQKRTQDVRRALPATVVQALYEMLDPTSSTNPFRDLRSKWRAFIVFVLLPHQGLRRGELLILGADAFKQGYDLQFGRERYWLFVVEHPDDETDQRYSTPSIKTVHSIRQLPVSELTANLAREYVENYRGKPAHAFLMNSQKGPTRPLPPLGGPARHDLHRFRPRRTPMPAFDKIRNDPIQTQTIDMDYYAFNIGDPITSEWWAENVQRGVITTGFDGRPGDEGERTLRRMNDGDWIFAYAKGHGFVGAGRFASANSYRLHRRPPADSLSNHRHERQVHWIHVITNLGDAIKATNVGARAPRHTAERIHDAAIAGRILSRFMDRPTQRAQDATSTDEYSCELWGPTGWRVVSVTYALTRPNGIIRCRECYGAIQLHVAGPRGVPRAHAEHRIGHPGCSLGHYFNGTHTPHPWPVPQPTDPRQVTASSVALEDDESAYPEGKKSYKLHRRLERDGKLPHRVKAKRLERTGKLECDVCAFDFVAKYGALGLGFIEAHHRRPVHQLDGTTRTKAKDLALVCSNCHRMLHRTKPQLSIEGLKAKLMAIPAQP